MTCLRKIFSLFLAPLLLTLLLWFLTDATVACGLGIIGFSSFLITDRTVGHTNKLNFLGRFGGFLDSFSWLKEKLFQKNLLKRELRQFSESFDIDRLLFCEHH